MLVIVVICRMCRWVEFLIAFLPWKLVLLSDIMRSSPQGGCFQISCSSITLSSMLESSFAVNKVVPSSSGRQLPRVMAIAYIVLGVSCMPLTNKLKISHAWYWLLLANI